MTLPKKKSRNIEVDGIKYRWMVGTIKYRGGMGYADVVVEDPKGKILKYTETLKSRKEVDMGWGMDKYIYVPVTPVMIRDFIRSQV